MQLDEELAMIQKGKSFHAKVADYAAGSAASFLSVLRQSFAEDYPGERQSDPFIYAEAVRGLDVFNYLEAYAKGRQSGIDPAGAIRKAFNDPRAASLAGLSPDLSSCQEFMAWQMKDHGNSPDFAWESLQALKFLADHLEQKGALGWGRKRALLASGLGINAVYRGGGIENLAPRQSQTAEGMAMKRAIDWLNRQSRDATLVGQFMKSNRHNPDTPEFEEYKKSAGVPDYYAALCQILAQCMKNNLETGAYVRVFSDAAVKKQAKTPSEAAPVRIHAHQGLYEYVQGMVMANVKIRLDGPSDPVMQNIFEKATNHLLTEFAREFPLPAAASPKPVL